jgi:hypothetical protein
MAVVIGLGAIHREEGLQLVAEIAEADGASAPANFARSKEG